MSTLNSINYFYNPLYQPYSYTYIKENFVTSCCQKREYLSSAMKKYFPDSYLWNCRADLSSIYWLFFLHKHWSWRRTMWSAPPDSTWTFCVWVGDVNHPQSLIGSYLFSIQSFSMILIDFQREPFFFSWFRDL